MKNKHTQKWIPLLFPKKMPAENAHFDTRPKEAWRVC